MSFVVVAGTGSRKKEVAVSWGMTM